MKRHNNLFLQATNQESRQKPRLTSKHFACPLNGKIINDPVYGFIRIPDPELLRLIDHPWFQRLRRIKQMGMAALVYPGAMHTRFHHSLGAMHLMQTAISGLKSKGISISDQESMAVRQAILLHDIGHGPFSHALEHTLSEGISHEEISSLIMERLRHNFNLEDAISIFDQSYPRPFLHQLVSSQLDMDRMDYLNRDSFYTGVSEGVIGYDRILQMLTVHHNELVVEEKGIHSVEKFIIARRLMYWQVYLHKTVLAAEQLIINILKRAQQVTQSGGDLFGTPALRFFLYENLNAADFRNNEKVLAQFCLLDDADITASIKVWSGHPDKILSGLCAMLQHRNLYRIRMSTLPMEDDFDTMKKMALKTGKLTEESLPYFLFYKTTSNRTYDQNDERINILMKSGKVVNISQVDNALINAALIEPIQKYYICYSRDLDW